VADPGLTGVLLVGGASRRFGSPKALARLGGETLAERGWRVLGEACQERIAVGKAADGLALPFPLLDDGTDVRHPAAGVVAALRAAANDVCVVLPVDCPSMTGAALRALGEACADAAVPEDGGPLPGAFRRSALPALERCLVETGSLRRALAPLDVRGVPLDPRLTADTNTRERLDDLDRARRQEVEALLDGAARWAAARGDVVAAAVVGSWARGAARHDSDVYLVILTTDPASYTEGGDWIAELAPGAEPLRDGDRGAIVERRLLLPSGLEVEVGIGPPSWAAAGPVDPGTRRVVRDGLRALFDPHGVLAELIAACRGATRGR
jgi:molybdopterin-guanine dinucleotide biosynthesis protein A/predicted nucleotidyltransferase